MIERRILIALFHCVITPQDNILITATHGRMVIKYIDFGLAIEATRGAPHKYGRAGTLEYMAPEVNARLPYSLNADVWSLGVVFFQVSASCAPRRRCHRGVTHSRRVFLSLFSRCTLVYRRLRSERTHFSNLVPQLPLTKHRQQAPHTQRLASKGRLFSTRCCRAIRLHGRRQLRSWHSSAPLP